MDALAGGRKLERWVAVAAIAITVVLFARNVAAYYFLNDDAFISFRYARFFADGHGLVWNLGERVEGYTSFLWVLLLAAGARLRIEPEILSNILGIASGVALLALLVRFSARRWGTWNPWTFAPPLVLALSRNFTAWCTGGQETMLFALLAFAAVDVYFEERRRAAGGGVVSSLLLALATLTRPEGMGLAAVVGAFAVVDVVQKRSGAGRVLRWGAPYLAIVGGHLLWRHAYYGAWLPNTFHAKVPGLMVGRGLEYLTWFHRDCLFGWFIPGILFAVWRARDIEHALLLAWVTAHLLYVVLIGGDIFEFRFLVFVFPAAYWLLIDGIRRMVEILPSSRMLLRAAAAGAVLLPLLFATGIGVTRNLLLERGAYLPSVPTLRAYTRQWILVGRMLRQLIDDGVLPRDFYLATGAAGAIPYYTRWRILDRYGLNDFEIARMPVRSPVLGHQHDVSLDYMRRRGVEGVEAVPIFTKKPNFSGPDGPLSLVRCVRIGDRYFAFLSLMSEDAFRAKFGRFEEVPNPYGEAQLARPRATAPPQQIH
ncbi:MAG: hypothetical protein U0167_06535 [bacterium]